MRPTKAPLMKIKVLARRTGGRIRLAAVGSPGCSVVGVIAGSQHRHASDGKPHTSWCDEGMSRLQPHRLSSLTLSESRLIDGVIRLWSRAQRYVCSTCGTTSAKQNGQVEETHVEISSAMWRYDHATTKNVVLYKFSGIQMTRLGQEPTQGLGSKTPSPPHYYYLFWEKYNKWGNSSYYKNIYYKNK